MAQNLYKVADYSHLYLVCHIIRTVGTLTEPTEGCLHTTKAAIAKTTKGIDKIIGNST